MVLDDIVYELMPEWTIEESTPPSQFGINIQRCFFSLYISLSICLSKFDDDNLNIQRNSKMDGNRIAICLLSFFLVAKQPWRWRMNERTTKKKRLTFFRVWIIWHHLWYNYGSGWLTNDTTRKLDVTKLHKRFWIEFFSCIKLTFDST